MSRLVVFDRADRGTPKPTRASPERLLDGNAPSSSSSHASPRGIAAPTMGLCPGVGSTIGMPIADEESFDPVAPPISLHRSSRDQADAASRKRNHATAAAT